MNAASKARKHAATQHSGFRVGAALLTRQDFTVIALAARANGGLMPYGACRRLLMEHAPNARA